MFFRRLGALLAVAVAAMVPADGMADAQTVSAQTGPSIVVHGRAEARGRWKRAESDHAIVFSEGGEGELRRVTMNLETLYRLMARLYHVGPGSDEVVRPQIVLMDSETRLRALGLGRQRYQEGPYAAAFAAERYYDAREDGDMIALARSDELIELNTTRRFNLDCDDYFAAGGMELCSGNIPYHRPIVRSWETALYAMFARRFILAYVPAAYPRWYLDGIGELFATFAVQRDGTADYAIAPTGYPEIFKSYGYPDFAAVLAGHSPDAADRKPRWSPYAAWLLTDYFLFSNLPKQREAQFQRYMLAIRGGEPLERAARLFGDAHQLQRDVVRYADFKRTFAHAEAPQPAIVEPLITPLSVDSGALLEARVSLESIILADRHDRADRIASLRERIMQQRDPEAWLLVGEAECRSGDSLKCLTSADRVLTMTQNDPRALGLKGAALTGLAIDGAPAGRALRLSVARRFLQRAIALDPRAPLPAIAYFESFEKAGEPVPDNAIQGMIRVIQAMPVAPAPRLYLGRELLRRGQGDLARRLLAPILFGPYETPEKRDAEALLDRSSALPAP